MLYRNCLLLIGVLFLQACLGCAMTRNADQRHLADQQSLEARLSLARLSERHGKLDFAKQIYEKALETSPDNVVAHHRLAVIDARQGRLAEADQHFKAAMKTGHPSVDLLTDYGYALYLHEDLDAAERVLREVVEREPRHTAARNNLALVLGEQGRFDESFQEFRMAVDEPEALANIAYVKSQMGEFEDAEKTYHRALALKGDMRPAAEALIQLAEIDGAINSSKSFVDAKPVSAPSPPSSHDHQLAITEPASATEPAGDIQLVSHVSTDTRSKPMPTGRPLGMESRRVNNKLTPARNEARAPMRKAQEAAGDGKQPDARTSPSFFPGSVSPKQIDLPTFGETPTASKIETIEPLPPPTFETSFVDDLNTEFPGGNTISSGESFLE